MQISGKFVGNGLDRSVRFTRYIALPVWLQRAAYMPPLQMTRNVAIAAHAPSLFTIYSLRRGVKCAILALPTDRSVGKYSHPIYHPEGKQYAEIQR